MSTTRSLTRRQALLLSGSAAAGLAAAGLPRWAQGAPSAGQGLPIPRLIEARNGEPVVLTLQKTQHRFGSGPLVPSRGISASYLGPVVRVRNGDTIPFRVENRLDEETTLHWHGMLVPSHVDGGPHNTIGPGAVWSPEITIKQPASTNWFHPHPHGNTARQVYSGLAGMMIVSDGGDGDRELPSVYGVDDLPIVLQDKRFGRNGEAVYQPDMMDMMHGFQGDTLVVNGVIGPVASVPAGMVRLRLLNAANARVFDLRFSDRRPFFVIAGDGGLLAEPAEVKRLAIAPAERYEVLVDFGDGRSVDLVTAPDAGHGPGMMMMPMMGAPAAFRRCHRAPDALQARSRIEASRHPPAPAARNPCRPGRQVSRRLAHLRAQPDDGHGHDGDGHGDDEWSRPRAGPGPHDGDQWPLVRHGPHRRDGKARHRRDLGDRGRRHADGASVPHPRRELQDLEQERRQAGRARVRAGRMSCWWRSTPRSSCASTILRLRKCRSCITATSSSTRITA